MKTCDKYDIDRFLSVAQQPSLPLRSLPLTPLCLWPGTKQIYRFGIFIASYLFGGSRTSSAPPKRHPHNFFCHQIYHQQSKVFVCLCVSLCMCVCWFRGVIFGQPPVEQEEKLGLICDKVRVALAVGKRSRLDCGYPSPPLATLFSCPRFLPLPLPLPRSIVPFCYLSALKAAKTQTLLSISCGF